LGVRTKRHPFLSITIGSPSSIFSWAGSAEASMGVPSTSEGGGAPQAIEIINAAAAKVPGNILTEALLQKKHFTTLLDN